METASPINKKKLSGQNLRLYEFLLTGKTIHCMSEDRIKLGIGYLNSRVSDLINVHGINLFKRFIRVDKTTVIEYSINPFL